MSYVEMKLIKGNLYGYIRQSIRVGSRVIHPNIGYLGRMDGIVRASSQPITYTPMEPEQERKTKGLKQELKHGPTTKGLNLKKILSPKIPGQPQGPGKEEKQIQILKKKKKIIKKKKTVNGYRLEDYLL